MNLAIAWSIFKALALVLWVVYTMVSFYTMIVDRRRADKALENLDVAQRNMDDAQKRMEAAQAEYERIAEKHRLSHPTVQFVYPNNNSDNN